VRVQDLSENDIRNRLTSDGLYFRLGGFTTRVRSRFSGMAGDFRRLYGPCEADTGNTEITDFHVDLDAPTRLRRYVRPQVIADVEGPGPFVPLPADLSLLMLETAMNWCMASRVRNTLILHSAVVEKDGEAVILPGESGSGKSTLAAALVAGGWRLLSDEFALIRLSDGKVMPYPRPISLKNESIARMKALFPDGVFVGPFEETPKGTLAYLAAPGSAIENDRVPANVRAFVFPTFSKDAALEADEWPKAAGFGKLSMYSVNYTLLGRPGFEALGDLVDRCPIKAITYSSLDDAIAFVESVVAASGASRLERAEA
jgi:HprK-related kinase A